MRPSSKICGMYYIRAGNNPMVRFDKNFLKVTERIRESFLLLGNSIIDSNILHSIKSLAI